MSRIILMEGAERVGKTEIGKALAQKLGIQYFKNHREHQYFNEKDSFALATKYEGNFLLAFLKQVKLFGDGIIIDRSFPSEYVYSKVFGRQTDESIIWSLDKEFGEMGAILVLCYKTEYKNYNDEHVPLEKNVAILETFKEYLAKTKMRKIELNTTDENLKRELKELELEKI